MRRQLFLTAIFVGCCSCGSALGEDVQLRGKVVPSRQSTLSAAVDGTIDQVFVAVGQRVKKGDVLVRLENRAAQARVKVAETELRVAKEEQVEAKTRVMHAEANLTVAKAELDLAELQLRRAQQLMRQKAISKEEFDNARAQVEAARPEVQRAAATLDSAKAGLRAGEARRDVLDARITLAQIELSQHTVRAPFEGIVVGAREEIGASVRARRDPLIHLASQDVLVIEAAAPLNKLGQLKVGDAATVVVPDVKDAKVKAKVAFIAPTVGDDGACAIRVTAAMPDTFIRFGMPARITIVSND